MQEEEGQYSQIIRSSRKNLVILQLLSNFFNDASLLSIFIRTQIIHNLFENNRALDSNKLDLFHVQYTSTLIELLHRLKKQKEQQYLLLSDEIYLNEDLVLRLENQLKEGSFKIQSINHAAGLSKKIAQLYGIFANDSKELFAWNEIMDFSKSVQNEYYREISLEQFAALHPDGKKVYQNDFVKFEKKLLGRLNILKFRIKFVCGIYYNDSIAEIFEFRDSNDMFIFFQDDKSFYFFDAGKFPMVDISQNKSAKENVLRELRIKTLQLKTQLANVRNEIPSTVTNVVKEYLMKISSVDFLHELQNVDEQTNILKAMLNININTK